MEGGAGVVCSSKAVGAGCHVIRDGAESEIPAAELVPGDLIVLAAGHGCPPMVGSSRALACKLRRRRWTGESLAVTKTSKLLQDKEAALGDRLNMAFLGTTITDGRGR